MSSPYRLAVEQWQAANDNPPVRPALDDISPEQSAAAVIGTVIDRTGVVVDSLTPLDSAILLKAASCLADMSGWTRADVIYRVVNLFGCSGVKEFRAKYGKQYRELLAHAGAELGTLQNAYTTADKWHKPLRSPELSYSHHMALNPLNQAERLMWRDTAIAEQWSVSLTRARVSDYLSAETTDDAHRWETQQQRIDSWCQSTGIELHRTNKAVTLDHQGQRITFRIVVLPSGPAIELGE